MSKRVLILDDDQAMRLFMQRLLEKEGCIVDTQPSGFDVENLVGDFVPDLLISDVMMPGRSGLDLCRALKANPATQQVPIILVSARYQLIDQQTAQAAGAFAYLPKPLPETLFLQTVRRVFAAAAPTA